MILVRAKVTAGPPFQVDDLPAGLERSYKGALHFRPGVVSLTSDEFEFAKKSSYGDRLIELGRWGVKPEPAPVAEPEPVKAAEPEPVVEETEKAEDVLPAPEIPPPVVEAGASDVEVESSDTSEQDEGRNEETGVTSEEPSEPTEGKRKKRGRRKRSS